MKEKYSWSRGLLRLYTIKIGGTAAVGASFYYGFEYLTSLLFYYIVIKEIIKMTEHFDNYKAAGIFVLWQITPLFFSILLILGLEAGFLSSNAIFVLQFWSTTIYPWIALLKTGWGYYADAYYAVLCGPWLSFLLYLLLLKVRKIKIR
ncbi:MAG: hypothetical protein LBR98_03105 [Syntrophomonadaceae bacterium]|jgi:hypothetical protein|nr:hypothetical protein [Syntrophomonadaceae bacterium]